MSTRARERGTRGRGRGRGARAGSSASGHMPEMEVLASPVTEAGSYDRAGGDNALSQAMLRVLKWVAGASTGSVARGSISERLWSNGAEVFKGISGVAPNMAEYWLKTVERIMDDLDCSFEDGLRDELRVLIAPQRERDFTTLVEKAKIAEEPCAVCGLSHQGGCWKRVGACFKCGSRDHRIKDCTLKSSPTPVVRQGGRGALGKGAGNTDARQPGLVYAAWRREDGDAPDVMM
ncbi:ATP-dependent zinc metalloprotease FtsH [Gossypium australe]|uniref:ATP-dependent zinc metalloprotease FtsH n=1 Tax=Gossypium australe TaxID=47621 RepID=A0A5B6VC14_9ROSI|nr:ATP-dependent zinc metalloprotease FtsH [Gossypium australe]